MKLTKENIETQIMLYVDNELSAEELRSLLTYLGQHPEYEALLREYQNSVLPPEELFFAEKNQLMQAENRKVIPFRIISGVAAAIAIILAIAGYYQWINNDDLLHNKRVMALNSSDSVANSQPKVVAKADNVGQKQDAAPAGKPYQRLHGRAQNVLPVNAPILVMQGQKKNVLAIKPMPLLPSAVIADIQQPEQVEVAPVEPDFSEQQPIAAQEPAHQPGVLPANQIAAILEQSDRLKGAHSLVAELDERKNKAVDTWQQIKSANVILKIGSKKIMIN